MKTLLVLMAVMVSFGATAEIKTKSVTSCVAAGTPTDYMNPTVVVTQQVMTGDKTYSVILEDGLAADGWVVDVLETTNGMVHMNNCVAKSVSIQKIHVRYNIEFEVRESTDLYVCTSSSNMCTM